MAGRHSLIRLSAPSICWAVCGQSSPMALARIAHARTRAYSGCLVPVKNPLSECTVYHLADSGTHAGHRHGTKACKVGG